MKILAIDPGYDRMGVAIVERTNGNDTLHYSACVQTSPKLLFIERLKILADEVDRIVDFYHPDAVALETLLFGKNEKTASRVAEVRGMLLYKSVSADLPAYEYTPLQVKVAVTGYGRADKRQVALMVRTILALDATSALDDETDAIAIALTHLAQSARQGLIDRAGR
ncbi:MAG: crossover junction endodeoxyribonuclease RuvC [Minisyncoccota bacterium]